MSNEKLQADLEALRLFTLLSPTKESFGVFLERRARTVEDFEIWQGLDRLYGEEMPDVRRRYHKAGEVVRIEQVTLERYLQSLQETTGYSLAQIGALVDLSPKDDLFSWMMGRYHIFSDDNLVESLIVGQLHFSNKESHHLAELVRKAKWEQERSENERRQRQRLNLTGYLRKHSSNLGLVLRSLRGRKGLSIAQVAQQAEMPSELWTAWEEATITPSAKELFDILPGLFWIWSTDRIVKGLSSLDLRAPELPELGDTALWMAFLNHWEAAGKSEDALYMPTRTTTMSRATWFETNQILLERDEKKQNSRQSALEAVGAARVQSEGKLDSFLRYRREVLEMSVEDMALRANVDVKVWLAWESGEALPTPDQASALASRLFSSEYLRDKMLDLCKRKAA